MDPSRYQEFNKMSRKYPISDIERYKPKEQTQKVVLDLIWGKSI